MHSALPLAFGLLLGVFGPRFRPLLLTTFAVGTATAGLFALAVFQPVSILTAAELFAAWLFGAVILARALPRVWVFLLLEAGMVAAAPLALIQSLKLPLPAVGIASLVLTVLLAVKAEVGLRVACALLGASLLVRPFSLSQVHLAILAAAVVLFLGSGLARRKDPVLPLPLKRIALIGLLLGALGGGGLLVLAETATTIPANAATAERLKRLAALAPRGGLIWPLPSEAIGWTDDVRGEFASFPNLDAAWLGAAPRGFAKLPGTTLEGRISLNRDVIGLRMVKDAAELETLKAAARASVQAVREALPLYVPGTPEAKVADSIRASHLKAGCSGESFPPIAASGASAAAAHGNGNKGVLKAGELVVTDVGCLVGGYASDFTRTIPVGGKFTERQRKIYDAVYAAQQAAVAACKPGVTLAGRKNPKSLDAIARATITRLGLEDHNSFGIGHSVGLFVHDPVMPGPLKEGMVVTIEPGIYLEGELGVRIEDTYVVTKTGCEAITVGFPADSKSVEAVAATALQGH